MTRLAVTGADGTVGRALRAALPAEVTVVPVRLPDYEGEMVGADAVLHLAFATGPPSEPEHFTSPHRNPVNTVLFVQALRGALTAGVPMFLHASSIHVEDTLHYGGPPLRALPKQFATAAASGYGRSKRQQEEALQASADRFPHGAVSLRLGAVTADNRPPISDDPALAEHERRVFCDRRDLAALVVAILAARRPGYSVVYAVSDNAGRFHDLSNPFGWAPAPRQ
ncbi:hypothetical protein LV457_11690 [Mycobacterium sp. MYCO198283]|uniref:NAD-dependent epimerase/dehydratase family protein n=1 Tax=Mycobacterium sp. MYCO198283 TaxID=2883505 RepID=UPI001E3F2269|nr:NAD-dependent epimerase/dehydratase family protein [Mycobacterium sp. MYCO198283]MCG5432943.1 hypothetical protein [Mycobacterium sp. MYCO198283]